MGKSYEPETLLRLQAIEMMITKDFVETCHKHGLEYWGFSGTGIGALRHRGFIPWDDDIDLYMPRRDYEKLIHYMTTEYGDKYYALNSDTDKNYPLATTRLCLTGTTFCEELMKDVDCPWGIFLDLYPVDRCGATKGQTRRQMWRAWYYGKLIILYETPTPYLAFGGFMAAVVRTGCRFMHWWLHFFHFSKEKLVRKRELANNRYNDCPDRDYAYFCDTRPDTNMFVLKDLYPLRSLPYERIELTFPNRLEEGLTQMYGDYMCLPPENQRKTHYPYRLDFGPYKELDPSDYLDLQSRNSQ